MNCVSHGCRHLMVCYESLYQIALKLLFPGPLSVSDVILRSYGTYVFLSTRNITQMYIPYF